MKVYLASSFNLAGVVDELAKILETADSQRKTPFLHRETRKVGYVL